MPASHKLNREIELLLILIILLQFVILYHSSLPTGCDNSKTSRHIARSFILYGGCAWETAVEKYFTLLHCVGQLCCTLYHIRQFDLLLSTEITHNTFHFSTNKHLIIHLKKKKTASSHMYYQAEKILNLESPRM